MLSRFELRRFRGLLPVLALLFAMLVPVIYGAVYLSANWDPYGNLSRLPVAVVNADQPVTYDGEQIHAGADITDELVDGHAFDWRRTTREDAEAGLREGRYYLVMEIPATFSADLMSPSGSDPHRAQITLRRNDANGFVIGSVTGSSQNKIENAVDKAAVEAYFKAVFKNLATIRQGMQKAAEGATQLASGTDSARSGSSQLASGLTSAKDGSGKLAAGLSSAQDGAEKLATGAATAKTGAHQLTTGAASAQTGSGKLLAGLRTAKTGSDKLATGAGQLRSGASQLSTGASQLSTGLGKLDTGSAKLATGAHQVADGTQQLYDTVVPVLTTVQTNQKTVAADVATINSDIQKLNTRITGAGTRVTGSLDTLEAKLDALAAADPKLASSGAFSQVRTALEGAKQRAGAVEQTSQTIATGSDKINSKVQAFVTQDKAGDAKTKLTQLNTGAHQVADGADSLHTGITQARTGADKLSTGASRLGQGAGQLSTGASQLSSGLGQLVTGAQQLDTGLGKLHDGSARLETGLGQLSTGATTLRDGVGKLATGATQLDTGLGKLSTGAGKLDAGLVKLTDGSHQLRDALKAGVQKLPVLSADKQDESALVLSSPVNVTMDVLNSAKVYGRGLAPLFFSIAMWVFGISGFLVMRPITGRLLAGRLLPLRLAVSAWLPFGTVAVLGAGLMLSATWALGLEPAHPWHVVGLTLLTSLVFSGIAHLMRTALNLPGSALLLVWLILQLASTGGTYPTEVLPAFFRWIHPFMPITYSIDAYRYAISGGLASRFWADVAVLVGIGLAAVVLDALAVMARQRFRLVDLHPPLQH